MNTSRVNARGSAKKGVPKAGDRSFAQRQANGVHALTDVMGRPYAAMLSAGNVTDVKAAPALLERAGRMRNLRRDNDYGAKACAMLCANAIPLP